MPCSCKLAGQLTSTQCVESNCTNGIDNDDDGYMDCEDFDCQAAGLCPETNDADCSDGVDNNGSGYIDCDDFSCQQSDAVTVCEGNAITCSDGLDNDGNGFTDCEEFACRYCDGNTPQVVATCPPCN